MASEKVFKAVMVGEPNSGKTSLRSHFLHNMHSWKYSATQNPDFVSTYVTLENDEMIAMQIWDTSGGTTDTPATNSLVQDADGIFLVISADDPNWLSTLREHFSALKSIASQVPVVLVQTKADSPQPSKMPENWSETAKKMCQEILGDRSIACVETSVRNGNNVSTAFRTMADMCYGIWIKTHGPVLSESLGSYKKREKSRTSRHGDPITAYPWFENGMENSQTLTIKRSYSLPVSNFRTKLKRCVRRMLCIP